MEPDVRDVTLDAGASCYITIDRTYDGSFGTVQVQTDNQDLLVFDDEFFEFSETTVLGLVEVANNLGWEPRTIFLANSGDSAT